MEKKLYAKPNARVFHMSKTPLMAALSGPGTGSDNQTPTAKYNYDDDDDVWEDEEY